MTVKGNWNKLMLAGAMRWKQWMTMGAVLMMMVGSLASQTTPQTNQRSKRITQSVVSGGIVTVAGTVHPMTQQATDLGAVNSNMQMDSLTLNIGLSAAQQTELNALLEAQQNAKSAQYHQWLTQEQYGTRFGLTDADLSAVTGWLTGQGFTVKKVSTSRNAITFSGKAWQAESAFHTQLHQYQLDGETHFANTTDLRVPAAIGSVILNVRGLDNFRPKPLSKINASPQFTYNATNHFLTPADWATIYNVNAIYAAGYDGTGTHVGVIGRIYAPPADIDGFRARSGLSATKINYICISSAGCTDAAGISDQGSLAEADLDIEWAGGIAKNATVDYVYASPTDPNQGVGDALAYAVQNYQVNGAVVPVLSYSYGGCEKGVPAAVAVAYLQLAQQANAQGQTILAASGDSGAAGCDRHSVAASNPAQLGRWADFPAVVPNITGVGGTSFSGDIGNPLLYWNPTIGLENSALKYIPEIPWNDTTDKAGLAAGGGGVSTVYQLPDWQWAPTNFIGTSGRFVPDVSFAASPYHDGYMICYMNSCSTTGFYSGGGTSASAPAFAGMLTLLTQKFGFLGNVNPTLYDLAKVPATYAAVFHDVTSGDINVPCMTNTTGCVDGVMGYAATTGYDLATGLGSIDGGALYAALAGTTGGTGASYTAVAGAVPVTLAAGSGTSVILTLTPTNYTGMVTLTATSSSPELLVSLSSSWISMVGGVQSPTLTIQTKLSAAKHAPARPWKSGGTLIFCVVLLGAPFTLRRKRAIAVVLTALAISLGGFLVACGGGSGGSIAPSGRAYTVTVRAVGAGTVTNPAPILITVNVP